MPYVQRSAEGNITGFFANLQPGYAEEWLLADNIEVVAFLAALEASMAADVSVSAFQAQAAMAKAQAAGITSFDLLAKVEEVVAASSDPLVPLAWNKATEFKRSSPTIAALAEQVPLTSEQIDQLFALAQTISA